VAKTLQFPHRIITSSCEDTLATRFFLDLFWPELGMAFGLTDHKNQRLSQSAEPTWASAQNLLDAGG
jgi:hypothetical protein